MVEVVKPFTINVLIWVSIWHYEIKLHYKVTFWKLDRFWWLSTRRGLQLVLNIWIAVDVFGRSTKAYPPTWYGRLIRTWSERIQNYTTNKSHLNNVLSTVLGIGIKHKPDIDTDIGHIIPHIDSQVLSVECIPGRPYGTNPVGGLFFEFVTTFEKQHNCTFLSIDV